MTQMLLLNPRRRRKARKSNPRRGRSAAQRAATRRLVAMNRAKNPAKRHRRRRARRANPVSYSPIHRRRRRRSNPIHVRRRRRNPSILGGMGGGSVVSILKTGAVHGALGVAMDALFGFVKPYLPASLLGQPNTIDIGDVTKLAFTVGVGKMLDKHTRGMSTKAAIGSITVQTYNLLAAQLGSSVTLGRLGYTSPARIVPMTPRIGPNIRNGGQMIGGPRPAIPQGMGQYVPGKTPLLQRYVNGGAGSKVLLNGGPSVFREGYAFR